MTTIAQIAKMLRGEIPIPLPVDEFQEPEKIKIVGVKNMEETTPDAVWIEIEDGQIAFRARAFDDPYCVSKISLADLVSWVHKNFPSQPLDS